MLVPDRAEAQAHEPVEVGNHGFRRAATKFVRFSLLDRDLLLSLPEPSEHGAHLQSEMLPPLSRVLADDRRHTGACHALLIGGPGVVLD